MIVGDPALIAIESEMGAVYESSGQRALGFFVIFVKGIRYGVFSPEATLLACSFDEVRERLMDRGRHLTDFSSHLDPLQIADAFCASIYDLDREDEEFFGMSCVELSEVFHSKKIIWAPDGDEAFDDGSYVLQFDIDDKVRVIAFRREEDGSVCDLSDVWIPANQFYGVLDDWQRSFEAEWLKGKGAGGIII